MSRPASSVGSASSDEVCLQTSRLVKPTPAFTSTCPLSRQGQNHEIPSADKSLDSQSPNKRGTEPWNTGRLPSKNLLHMFFNSDAKESSPSSESRFSVRKFSRRRKRERLMREHQELLKRRQELAALTPSDFVAWSFVIYPDDGPTDKFLARATFVRPAAMFSARDWGRVLLYIMILLVTMFGVLLMIGPVGAVVWGMWFAVAQTSSERFLPRPYLVVLLMLVCVATICYKYLPHRSQSFRAVLCIAICFDFALVIVYYCRDLVALPTVRLPRPTLPLVYNFDEKELGDFIRVKQRFGLMKHVFVGNHYAEGAASTLIPSVIFNSLACRRCLSITINVILPLSFILAASHHIVGWAGKLRNLVDQDWLVVCFRFFSRFVPWEVMSWNLFGVGWILEGAMEYLQLFIWTIIIPFDTTLTTVRARINQLLGAMNPLAGALQHVRAYTQNIIRFAGHSVQPLRSASALFVGIFRLFYSVIGTPVKMVFEARHRLAHFTAWCFSPLTATAHSLISGFCTIISTVFAGPTRVIMAIVREVSVPLLWWKNQLLFVTPTSGRSIGWWKFVQHSIAGLWAKVYGYTRVLSPEASLRVLPVVSYEKLLREMKGGRRSEPRERRRFSAPPASDDSRTSGRGDTRSAPVSRPHTPKARGSVACDGRGFPNARDSVQASFALPCATSSYMAEAQSSFANERKLSDTSLRSRMRRRSKRADANG